MNSKTIRKRVDRVDTIKTLLQSRIDHHESMLADAKAQLKKVESVESLLSDLGVEQISGVHLGKLDPKQPYALLGLTDALVMELKGSPNTPRTIRDLRESLVRGGFLAPPKHFAEKVNATLHHLASRGEVKIKKDEDGRNWFIGNGLGGSRPRRKNRKRVSSARDTQS